MFKKVLIANRGEIALRVIRACRELELATVSVHSEVDRHALHVKFADESVCIGPGPSKQSYLNIPAIISAAEITGADAVHPGYGFLAENAEFAEVCEKCGLGWIGPPPSLMRLMGDKVRARAAMADVGVPILPGTGVVQSEKEALAAADRIGFPLIIKAAAGGGGRGMKIVEGHERLGQLLATAQAEAQAAFGNPDVYMERYLTRPRHIEMQVIADKHGAAAHLGERECSIQRRHQKLVEEAPSPALTDAQRERLGRISVKAIREMGYHNVGTLEFLLDEERGEFYFMEMNTRIQVEHTVTEMVTGLDLVREQILLAVGEKLSFGGILRPRGHAIELRINAEDPSTFAPSPGKITALHVPGGLGVRVDTHVYDQYVVPPHYDSLIAKLIVHAADRRGAIRRLKRCLDEFVVEGIKTNLEFHARLLEHPDFLEGRLDTHFLARMALSSSRKNGTQEERVNDAVQPTGPVGTQVRR
ncbi:MAG: acetyl-CoA carboxylase biotin carboxylase subunit [Deltaproteobacteria bacterium]|nr:acetyl-CoA carboxylase biotin carboxylase subunit [Deltaproteobacteria bacterium]